MRLRVLAVGSRMPDWVDAGVAEYHKRMPREWSLEWLTIPPAKRRGDHAAQARAQEGDAIFKALKPREQLVTLDVAGELVSTESMAQQLSDWQMQGADVALVIGGADGIDHRVTQQARGSWSFGRITLPHPLVRVILAEQLYRAWSINAQHPYHRG